MCQHTNIVYDYKERINHITDSGDKIELAYKGYYKRGDSRSSYSENICRQFTVNQKCDILKKHFLLYELGICETLIIYYD